MGMRETLCSHPGAAEQVDITHERDDEGILTAIMYRYTCLLCGRVISSE